MDSLITAAARGPVTNRAGLDDVGDPTEYRGHTNQRDRVIPSLRVEILAGPDFHNRAWSLHVGCASGAAASHRICIGRGGVGVILPRFGLGEVTDSVVGGSRRESA
jgi:hypothetical protein